MDNIVNKNNDNNNNNNKNNRSTAKTQVENNPSKRPFLIVFFFRARLA
jgi:hypothetical protein